MRGVDAGVNDVSHFKGPPVYHRLAPTTMGNALVYSGGQTIVDHSDLKQRLVTKKLSRHAEVGWST